MSREPWFEALIRRLREACGNTTQADDRGEQLASFEKPTAAQWALWARENLRADDAEVFQEREA